MVDLFAFQISEILDVVKYTTCALLLIVGIGIWVHATFFRGDN